MDMLPAQQASARLGKIKREGSPNGARARHVSEQKVGLEADAIHAAGAQEIGQADGHGGGDLDKDGNLANLSSNSDGPVRKRRRNRKGLDKKFECPEKGCGRSYSRAEHLYRHQLNHNPKQVYHCDIGGCERTFVRQDLCNRHRERHMAKGTDLSRKNSFPAQASPGADGQSSFLASITSSKNRCPAPRYGNGGHVLPMAFSSKASLGTSFTPIASASSATYQNEGLRPSETQKPLQHSPAGLSQPDPQTDGHLSHGILSPVATQQAFQPRCASTSQPTGTVGLTPTAPAFPSFSLPSSDFSADTAASNSKQTHRYASATSSSAECVGNGADMMIIDQMSLPVTIPVFGDSTMNKSPYVGMPEDFMAFLFNTQQGNERSSMSNAPMQGYSGYGESAQSQYSSAIYGQEASQVGYFPAPGTQQVMSVTNLLERNLPESIITDEKSLEVFEFVRDRFHEAGDVPIERQPRTILDGDRSRDNHVLSRRMMQAYIASFWVHFSEQIPIIHKPTFSPQSTKILLLIAMMTIGAACLDKAYTPQMTRAGARLSEFLAWHLRWVLFQDMESRPPAKLWTFQTFILLELYEKMYSTRELHERAHVHHATTIALMRRGRALTGRSALDSPPHEKQTGSWQSSTSAMADTPDQWWNQWITTETTRRTAFAAFVVDSIHAAMFRHSAVMAAHEMRLSLPCDDKLWKATSGSEVGRIEANLQSTGTKSIGFLEALRRTLNGQEVQTQSFGRTILMAGLLNVSWHMSQRDQQITSLMSSDSDKVLRALGKGNWRTILTRAFDYWKIDFDRSLRETKTSTNPYSYNMVGGGDDDVNTVFESRIVLHHLAHMFMHVDIVDCQTLARAKWLLGRPIGSSDFTTSQRRLKNWSVTAKARDATYYALKFIMSVMTVRAKPGDYSLVEAPYSARDDALLNRSWVLYYAALVVWCYGYTLEGPCPNAPVPTNRLQQRQQMHGYLTEFANIATPDDLKLKQGMNANTALLMALKDSFNNTRWTLLHEGAQLLDNCIHLNAGVCLP